MLGEDGSDSMLEAALPAYAHPNPVIRRLFWQRLAVVLKRVRALSPDSVLDFGCGSGVMLPLLAGLARRVVGLDPELGPYLALRPALRPPGNVEVYSTMQRSLSSFPDGSVDVVIALDVLEHVQDLDAVAGELCRVVAPAGEILVSGPTENILYRLGRRLAGRQFTGDYHVRNVADVRQAFLRRAAVSRLRLLYSWLPLFEIFSVRRVPH